MILCSLGVVFGAFAPFVPLRFGLEVPTAWRVSSLFLFLVSVGILPFAVRDARRLGELGMSNVQRFSGTIVVISVAGLSALGASGSFARSAPALYLLALLILLGNAGFLFAAMMLNLLLPPREPE